MKRIGIILGILLTALTTTAFAWAACPPGTMEARPGSSTCILDPAAIPQFVAPLPILGAMPAKSALPGGGKYYEIAVKQFSQQILPAGYGATKIWSYVKTDDPATYTYPAFTVETRQDRKDQVKWINGLVDGNGKYLPHLLPVDQTLHWANPPKDCAAGPKRTDCAGDNPAPYNGPVPIITHVHGAHVFGHSDGFPEAWYLPAAKNIPAGYARQGSKYDSVAPAGAGAALFEYPNDQPPTTLWYHDHTLGMTRTNVYAGPAGFWLIRPKAGTPEALVEAALPSGAREIPVLIQDRSFNPNGSLFYPDNRAYFEGLSVENVDIPFIPSSFTYPDGTPAVSDIPPIWNPEFFGNTMVVNGKSWPYLDVKPAAYRFRFLNGSNSRFLILKLASAGESRTVRPATPVAMFHQFGADQGFLPQVASQEQLLLGPSERADVVVDFSAFAGQTIYLINEGPDEPFGGGLLDIHTVSDPATTGQVMKIRVAAFPVAALFDSAAVPLPGVVSPGTAVRTRQLSLNEESSSTILASVEKDADGNVTRVFLDNIAGEPFAPKAAKLGGLMFDESGPMGMPMMWGDPQTETPQVGDTEVWEIWNFTEDAHPIHVHLVQFKVVGREVQGDPAAVSIAGSNDPLPWEMGYKDTVIAYPGEITRIIAKFDRGGQYVWHCHILEHEDQEMMRPYVIQFDPAFPDLNEDGRVTAADLVILLREINLGHNNLAYDLNRDNTLNLKDALFLVKKIVQ